MCQKLLMMIFWQFDTLLKPPQPITGLFFNIMSPQIMFSWTSHNKVRNQNVFLALRDRGGNTISGGGDGSA